MLNKLPIVISILGMTVTSVKHNYIGNVSIFLTLQGSGSTPSGVNKWPREIALHLKEMPLFRFKFQIGHLEPINDQIKALILLIKGLSIKNYII